MNVDETIATLRAAGLHIDTWAILSQSNRWVLELLPCRVIAKVVPISALARLELEVAVAEHVAACTGACVRPAAPPGPFVATSSAVSLWEPIAQLGAPPEAEIGDAYAALRRGLDSFTHQLPDFRDAITGAHRLLQHADLPGLAQSDNAFVRASFEGALARMATFHWTPRVLHGDPHSGNLALTADGSRWFDLESVCFGPLEWDLTALPACTRGVEHDAALFIVLMALRRLCVVAWCAAKAAPSAAELEAIAHHLAELKAR